MTTPLDTDAAIAQDYIRPFQLDRLGLRGRVVRIHETADDIIRRHGYPDVVGSYLAQALALTGALAGALKFDGIFTLQTKSDGPISLLMADFTSPGSLRGYAQYDAEALAALDNAGLEADFRTLFGSGYIAFTIDQGGDMERYQGIVEIQGESLADCALGYFRNSEQLDTVIRVASNYEASSETPGWRAGAIMLQRLPEGDPGLMARGAEYERSESDEDAWNRVGILLATATDEELTSFAISSDDLLFRLYHQDDVRVYEAKPLQFRCRCSDERAKIALSSLPEQDREELAAEDALKLVCEFCSTVYSFTAEDFRADG